MTNPTRHPSPQRWAVASIGLAIAAVGACLIHAAALAFWQVTQQPALRLVERLRLSDLCLARDDDLRHPGWARQEQAKAGQPALIDARPARILVQPVPLRVHR